MSLPVHRQQFANPGMPLLYIGKCNISENKKLQYVCVHIYTI